MTFDEAVLGRFLAAVTFAADKHAHQRRKGADRLPYVNHPIHVAKTLWDVGGVRDPTTLIAALLHDTIEDTDTAPEEIAAHFGSEVLRLVQAVTDDKSLPKAVRKQLQIDDAGDLPPEAKVIKLADKIRNVQDLSDTPPAGWPRERLIAYVDWADAVVAGLRDTNAALEAYYDRVSATARAGLLAGSVREAEG